MPIVLKYGSPGPILAAGYAAGAGHRMHEQQDDALKVWQQNQQQQFQAGQSWLDRLNQQNLQQGYFNQQNQLAQGNRQFQAGQAELQRSAQAVQTSQAQAFASGESMLDRQSRDIAATDNRQNREAEQQRHEQFVREQNTELGLRRGELTLPPAAQAQLQKLEADKIEAMKLDPAKQAEFMGKYTDQKRGLYGMAQPSNQVPYDERLRSSLGSNYEQYKDLPWQFNEQGERSLPSGFKMPGDLAGEQQNKFNDSVMKQYEKNLKEVDENNKPLYGGDENKALQAAIDSQNQIERGRQRLVARGNTPDNPVAATPQATPQVAGPAAQAQPVTTFTAGGAAQAVPRAARPQITPPPTQATPQATRPAAQFDLGNLPSNMLQIPQNQRQTHIENMPQHINELPNDLRKKYKESWPSPATPEAASKLAPGTIFTTPEGRIKTVPF